MALVGQFGSCRHGFGKTGLVADHMIGGQNEERSVASIGGGDECGGADGGRSVAAFGFEQQADAVPRRGLGLGGDQKIVVAIADHDGGLHLAQRRNTPECRLQKRVLDARRPDIGLRQRLARYRPQAHTLAARQNHRPHHCRLRLPFNQAFRRYPWRLPAAQSI